MLETTVETKVTRNNEAIYIKLTYRLYFSSLSLSRLYKSTINNAGPWMEKKLASKTKPKSIKELLLWFAKILIIFIPFSFPARPRSAFQFQLHAHQQPKTEPITWDLSVVLCSFSCFSPIIDVRLNHFSFYFYNVYPRIAQSVSENEFVDICWKRSVTQCSIICFNANELECLMIESTPSLQFASSQCAFRGVIIIN